MNEATLAQRIDAHILLGEGDLADATRAHAEAALKLVENPGGKSIQEELAQLEEEQAIHRRTIANLKAARAEAARRDTVEAKAAELANFKAKRAAVAARFEKLAEIAVKLKAVWEVKNALQAEYSFLARQQHPDVWPILRAVFGPKVAERRYPFEMGVVVRGDDAADFIANNLNSGGSDEDLKNALRRGTGRVLAALDAAIAHREAGGNNE